MTIIQHEAVEQAEAVLDGEEGVEARDALTELLNAYRTLRNQYNYLAAQGVEPDPVEEARRAADSGRIDALQVVERSEDEADQLLDVEAVAERLDVQERYVYDHADDWPFTRRLSPRKLRFSERGLNRWLSTRP